jgi:predicted NAD/FAD-dependent oxidoreductase
VTRFPAALPADGYAPDPDALAAARSAGLSVAGDWVAGAGRVHAAVRSGLEAGERLAVADGR